MSLRQEKELGYAVLSLDKRAVKCLLDSYETPVYRFFYYSVGHVQDAQDLCGQTFSEFVKAVQRKTFTEPERLRAFIFGIARNVLRQTYRHKKRHLQLKENLDHLVSRDADVSHRAGIRDDLNAVFRVIHRFKEPARQVMLLRFVEGLKIQEIAEAMDLPINSVKSYIYRCREQLKEQLSDNPHES